MTDPLEQFRKIKVPLWARLLGDWRAWRRARQRRKEAMQEITYVCTVHAWLWLTKQKLYASASYHLFHDFHGERWYEYHSNPLIEDGWETRHSTYRECIYPWLNGSWDDETMRRHALTTEMQPERRG